MAAKVIKGGGGAPPSDESAPRPAPARAAPKAGGNGGEERASGVVRAGPGMMMLPPSSDDDSAMVRADQIVADALKTARALEAQAEQEAQAGVATAIERGGESGRESAAEFGQMAERLTQMLNASVEKDALEAAVEAAKELMLAEIKHRPGGIVDVVKQALASGKHQKEIFVRCNPKDAATLKERKRELLDVLSRARDVDIREDPGVAQGGCVVETELGIIDAQLPTQLEVLSRRLLGLGG
ncbi:MAG: FliH/SctL family protein [Myxococcota bacterium]